jgi:hypothetical protein
MHRLVELTAIAWSSGLVLADQVAQDALATDGGKDDVPHDAVGPFDRGLRQRNNSPVLPVTRRKSTRSSCSTRC